METTPAARQKDNDLLGVQEADLQQPGLRACVCDAALVPAPRVPDKKQHNEIKSPLMRDGNELLLLREALAETRDASSDAILALQALAERLAEGDSHTARLELLVDTISELHPGIVVEALGILGWEDV